MKTNLGLDGLKLEKVPILPRSTQIYFEPLDLFFFIKNSLRTFVYDEKYCIGEMSFILSRASLYVLTNILCFNLIIKLLTKALLFLHVLL